MGGRRKEGGEAKRREEMKKPLSLLILILLLFFLWGCGQWGVGLPEHMIAQVNEEQIPVEEFDREFKELILEPGKEAKGDRPWRSETGLSRSGDRTQDSRPRSPTIGNQGLSGGIESGHF